LALLQAQGVEVEIIEYLNDPPSKAVLKALLAKLGIAACELVRTKEPEYKTLIAGRALDDDELLGLLAEHPRLLQRPIVTIGDRARIGRPPEKVLELTR
jgi:arsenate reductase